MRRVIKEVDADVISISKIDNFSIVGIDWSPSKCVIVRVGAESFKSISNYNGTPSLLNTWERRTQSEYVEAALNQGSHVKVYVFDSTKELFKWMSE